MARTSKTFGGGGREEGGVKRKRRVQSTCVNSLFVKWVEELRDDAKERGLKSHYSYTKAINSLKRYPLPLRSGEEAKLLDNVGQKVAKILDRKLAEYQSHKDSDSDLSDTLLPDLPHKSLPIKTKAKPPKKCSSTTTATSSFTSTHQDSSKRRRDEREEDSHSPPASKTKKKRRVREYVPAYRSGPYALIIALYRAKEKPSWRGFLLKADLIADAQPLSDMSFTIPDPGSYYTAWSSMSSIIRKGLVQKISHPPKFSLTESGEAMACKLLQGSLSTTVKATTTTTTTKTTKTTTDTTIVLQDDSDSSSSQGKGKAPRKASKKKTLITSPDLPSTSENQASPSEKTQYVASPPSSFCSDIGESCSLEGSDMEGFDNYFDPSTYTSVNTDTAPSLPFWYIDSTGKTVIEKDKAMVTFNTVISVGFLIKAKQEDLEAANILYSIDEFRKADGPYIYAYLSNEDAPERACPPSQTTKYDNTSSISKVSPISAHPSKEKSSTTSNNDLGSLHENPHENGTKIPKATSIPSTFSSSKKYDSASQDPLSPQDSIHTISLVDSEDEEEMAPLMSRVQSSKNHLTNSGDQKANPAVGMELKSYEVDSGSEKQKGNSKSCSDSGTALRKGEGKKGNSKSCSDSVRKEEVEKCSLTPAQVAGRAAIRRFDRNQLNKRSSETEQVDSSRVIDLTTNNNKRNSREICHLSSSSPSLSPAKQPETATPPNPESTQASTASTLEGTSGTLTASIDIGDPEFVLTPGKFEVVLIVDSSESTASRKSTSQFRGILLQELGKNGVSFDVRRLNVGDFTWIAREKSLPTPGSLMLPKSCEAVLEYIVERKRMDDLAGSIIDGRFNEQKFRLKNSGILHPIYLVEEHGDAAHLNLDMNALNQAVANTQIVDGFFVKRTKDIRESVAYLTLMTRSLQVAYAGQTIKAYPWEAISELNKGKSSSQRCNLSSVPVLAMEFSKFNEASVKNKTLTVHEMFGRHLIQLPGFSAEKAAVLLQKYPTISHLRQAYSSCASESDKVKLVEDLRSGPCKRRFGFALSQLLYSVYCTGKTI